jgi:hypothetical protein
MGVINLFTQVSIATSIKIKNNTIFNKTSKVEFEHYNYQDDNNIHVYFFVDFNITIHENIFCCRLNFDIQGRQFIPFFKAVRLRHI